MTTSSPVPDRDSAGHVSLHDPGAVATLLQALHEAGATGQVAVLASRAATGTGLDVPGVATLLWALREVGATGQVTILANRAATEASLDDPGAVARLLRTLDMVGATGQVATLLDRDPAAHTGPGNPAGLTALLDALREAGATAQVSTLLDRDRVVHTNLGYRYRWGMAGPGGPRPSPGMGVFGERDGIPGLLRVLREVGAQAQAAELIERLPAAGMFELFSKQEDRGEKFRFGREANGRPAGPWAWTDLD